MKSSKSGFFVLIAVFVIVAYAVVSLILLQIDINEQKIENKALQGQLEELAQSNDELRNLLEGDLTDAEIERYAREYLNMGYPGEQVLIDIGNE
ncbi:MAG: hypothetical protein E7491_06950 [Ruminococcaceae bacterium]|nr:hypothetical protein [Oscillospiraceae bacterium]